MKHFLGTAFAVVLIASVMTPNTARSAVIITFEETGGSITMDLSGSLDLTGATPLGTNAFGTLFSPTSIIFGLMLVTGTNTVDVYAGLSGPSAVGGGGLNFVIPASPSSTSFWLQPVFNQFAVPEGYASGDPLNVTLSFTGQSFATMGLTQGDQFIWTIPSGDTITMNIGTLSVPAPAGLPLALAAFGAVALIRRRKHAAV